MSRPDSILCPFDAKALQSVSMTVLGTPIAFQFLPKINTETNSVPFKENAQGLASIHPVRTYVGAGGRQIQTSFEYIATGNVWTPKIIAIELRKIKTYFYKPEGYTKAPLVTYQHGEQLPIPTDFYMLNINITHGDNYVAPTGELFPLYTKVEMSLALATSQKLAGGKGERKEDAQGLKDCPPAWF